LTIDDTRWLVVPVREEVRVLCVAGREGAARYVATALNPNPAGSSPIRPIVISEGDLAEVELADFDCVFMCNVAQFTAGEAERLQRYTENGGGIVFFLGDRVIPERYNSIANPQAASGSPESSLQPVLPARIGGLLSNTQFGLDPLDYRHPIVGPFRGRERGGLLTTPVSRYYRLELIEGRLGVEVAAATPNGDPFIVTAPLGRGRIVLVATAASLSSVDAATGEPWTNWPTWPSFLPIVRELLAYASGGRQQAWQQVVGTPLGGTLPAAPLTELDPGALQIVRPDGRSEPVAVQAGGASWEWSYAATDVSGIYRLRGLPEDQVQPFAVNVDTSESDLAKADPRQLPPELSLVDNRQEAGDGSQTQTSRAGWSQSLLWAALAMLLIESYLAWQFGRGAV
jgi:hypothetical protein